MPIKHEIRAGIPAEIRADDEGILVTGYAAVFNQETNIGGYFREVIKPGAFAKAIKEDDVLFLVDHKGLPLARTKSGTLELKEDKHGLHIETRLDPKDPDVQAIEGKMKRGDLDEMSFAFYPVKQEWDDSEDIPLRTLVEVKLDDVAIVGRPAYEGTEIGIRSLEASLKNLENHREKSRRETNFKATRKRLRMKADLAVREGKLPAQEKGD